MSSAKIKDGWLSDEACRDGESKLGVPALLKGREKLKDGRGRADDSELTEGDLRAELKDGAAAWTRAVLPDDNLRGGKEWKDPPILLATSSLVEPSGADRMLDDRLGNNVLGGASPRSSRDPGFVFLGDPALASCWNCGRPDSVSVRLFGEFSTSRLRIERLSDCIGDGERSRRAPKSVCSLIWFGDLSRRLSRSSPGSAGTDSSGVGGMRLIRGCIDLGRSSARKASSTSPLFPESVGLNGGRAALSSGDSTDKERKYSERPWRTSGLSDVSGGSRLSLLPSFALSCSCFASKRLCRANASRGDSSGGASPAMCIRGDRRGPREPVELAEPCELARRSKRPGRGFDMAIFGG